MTTVISDSWAQCLESLKGKLFPQSYDAWLKPLRCERFDGEEVVLYAAHSFTIDWVRQYYLKDISDTIQNIYGTTPEIRLLVDEEEQQDTRVLGASRGVGASGQRTGNGNGSKSGQTHPTSTAVDDSYVFDSFVVGCSNEIAYSAARTIAENPGRTPYNPLLIFGGVGTGKTHLLKSVANQSAANGERKRSMYVTSEQFCRDFTSALRKRRTSQFAERYRNIDVLLVDDIQFFEGKKNTIEEFFHTFNALHSQGKQIVLASDRPPDELTGLNERLISRIKWGLVADIQTPEMETRATICQSKAADCGIDLNRDIAEVIAGEVRDNVRELEGVVKRVLFLVETLKKDLTRELVEGAIDALGGGAAQLRRSGRGPDAPMRLDVPTIVTAVAEHYHLDRQVVLGPSRKANVVLARQLAAYLCRQLTPLAVRAISSELGGRNHTTILHAIQKVNSRMADDPGLLLEARLIADRLGARDVVLGACPG
jgi:chromosomal replication initiator protein